MVNNIIIILIGNAHTGVLHLTIHSEYKSFIKSSSIFFDIFIWANENTKYEKIIKVELSGTSMKGLKVDGTLWTVGIGGESETHADTTTTFESSYIHGDGIKRGESDIVNYPVKANLENVVDFTTRGNIVIAKTANKDLYTWGSYMLDYNEETKTTKYKTYTDYTKVASNARCK